ncbi:hypothetical protein [Planctomyces sp. SH-PL62]|uniref:hypothetical protein n=1 Tax=Planctomyces sp. SH-PL62 TaxID=1636152 RepID=UPI00078E6318|nr:hypothetical protein [Planctomyces sp. SH-PL62]AMV38068.1 hypothetical protein VT85_11565 [Planctomyces sp. SH-PL62]
MLKRETVLAAIASLIAAPCIALIARGCQPTDRFPDDFSPAYRSYLADQFKKYKAGKASEVVKVKILDSVFNVHLVDSGRGEIHGFAPYHGDPIHLWVLTDEYEVFAYNDEAIFLKIGLKSLSKFR